MPSHVDIPQQPSGYATVEVPVPAGWTARSSGSEADWTVDVPVGGRPRVAQVSAWVSNGQVITVYASGPADSAAAAAVLTVHDHATGLRVWTHIGPEAG